MKGEKLPINSKDIKQKLTKDVSLPHKILVDTLGILLIILAGLTGWLPGPGGIPLFLAGLTLLANNHAWARKILAKVTKNGGRVFDLVFKEYRWLVITYDIFAALLLAVAALLIGKTTGNLLRGIAIVLIYLAIGLLLGNKKRLNRLTKRINKIIRNK